MSDNQLQVIVRESNLEATKAQSILDQFQDYFKIAAEWEVKAKTIVVTDPSQKAEMKMAREARLFLKEKRVAVEAARKNLKEQALREGKAIDGIANILKALIVPIEEYLESQEKFVEIRAEAERKRIEAERLADEERKAEAGRIAREAVEREEQERIRKENESLKALQAERDRREAAERQKHEEELAAERKKGEEALQAEREKAEKAQAELLESEQNAACLAAILTYEVECPFCHNRFVPPITK